MVVDSHRLQHRLDTLIAMGVCMYLSAVRGTGREMIEMVKPLLCFPEPSPSKRREPKRGSAMPDWLRTVDDPTARSMRRFLNENIAQLPESFQAKICHALKKRWDSAYFELIVARTLQLLGATIEVEPESEAGTRIDYHSRFADSAISVEAISPNFNVAIEAAAQAREPLIDIVESLAPEGWSVFVRELPRIGPNEKKDELKRVLRELFAIAPPLDHSEHSRELAYDMGTGAVHVVLYPRRPGWPVIAGSGQTWWGDDSVERIRRSVKTKRKQARNSPLPTIIAVGARVGAGITHSDAFVDALYGERTAVENPDGEMHHEFAPGGEFALGGSTPPTYAGLLAFSLVGIDRIDQPVLFHHPRYSGSLPEALLSLEQHSFDPDTRRASKCEARSSDVLVGLNLVPDNVESKIP